MIAESIPIRWPIELHRAHQGGVAVTADPLRTPLCDLLGIRLPILLAPMAGGPATPELVAAVTRAGGAGFFGATGMTSAAIAEAVERALALAGPPVGVNVQLAPTSSTVMPGRSAALKRA